MDTQKQDFEKAIENSIARLQCNNLDLHVILYFEKHMFEFNPLNKVIRPFNSLLWYDLTKEDKYYGILGYLELFYNKVSNFDISEYDDYDFISLANNTIAIDIEGLRDYIILDISTFFCHNNKAAVIRELDKLKNDLNTIYGKWNKLILHTISEYEEIGDIFLLG